MDPLCLVPVDKRKGTGDYPVPLDSHHVFGAPWRYCFLLERHRSVA